MFRQEDVKNALETSLKEHYVYLKKNKYSFEYLRYSHFKGEFYTRLRRHLSRYGDLSMVNFNANNIDITYDKESKVESFKFIKRGASNLHIEFIDKLNKASSEIPISKIENEDVQIITSSIINSINMFEI